MHIILLILPLLFQIFFGTKALKKKIKLRFATVCLISFIAQILLTIFDFKLIEYLLEGNNNACGMPLIGVLMLSLVLSLILFAIMIIQHFIRKSYKIPEN